MSCLGVRNMNLLGHAMSNRMLPVQLQKFLDDNNLDLVCRAHQVVAEGYEFFANRSLVTIFSAPNYCNEFDNAASMMTVAKDLTCTFRILRPQAKLSQAIRDKTSKLL